MEGPAKKTVTTSIRMPEEIYLALEKEAKENNISLNTQINQALRYETEFAIFGRRIGYVSISRATLRALLDALEEKVADRVGAVAGNRTPRNFILARYGMMNLNSVLGFLNTVSAHSKIWGCSVNNQAGKTTIVLNHDLGKMYSVFLLKYMKALFESVSIHPKITETDESVILEF